MAASYRASSESCCHQRTGEIRGAVINATDLRASASLLAATRAPGRDGDQQRPPAFRGYQDLPQKMMSLGATLEIVQSKEVV